MHGFLCNVRAKVCKGSAALFGRGRVLNRDYKVVNRTACQKETDWKLFNIPRGSRPFAKKQETIVDLCQFEGELESRRQPKSL